MKRNIKTIRITIPNEIVLNRIKNTPALRNLSRLELRVGKNIENVNHAQYEQAKRMFPVCGCTVEDIEIKL